LIFRLDRLGKATIYRWCNNKGTLIMERYIRGLSPELLFPDGGSASADIVQQMTRLFKVRKGSTRRIVRAMIAMGQYDPEMLRILSTGYLRPRRETEKEVRRHGIAQSDLRADVYLDFVTDALYAFSSVRLNIEQIHLVSVLRLIGACRIEPQGA
jgi:hypothetical protein